jgi:DNA polymerase III subunit gamma/tau
MVMSRAVRFGRFFNILERKRGCEIRPCELTFAGETGILLSQTRLCLSSLPSRLPYRFMSYQVLARRWRPQRFAEVVGQEHVTRTLQNAIRQGRLAHAFLFTGPRGIGKTSTARILARAVNCPNLDSKGEAEPCNKCETCRALLEDRELDVIEMDAASYTGVDDIRRVIENSRLAPVAGRMKIYIIDEVHMLSRSAFNAFLKTLEEPPAHVIFILATTDPQKVPATVLSRVQRFDFRPVQPLDTAPFLAKICQHEGWLAEEEALWLIARRSEGSLRDAEGLLDQVVSYSQGKVTLQAARETLGALPGELLAEATEMLAANNVQAVPPYLEQLAVRGVDYTQLLKDLQAYWMDLIFIKQGLPIKGRVDTEIEQMQKAGGELSVEDLFRLIHLAERLEDDLKWSTAPRVRFEISFVRWASLDRVATIHEILNRLGSAASGSVPSSSKAAAPPHESPAASERAPKTTPPADEITLDLLHAKWPDILAAFRKHDPSLAATAENSWILESLNGRKLTVSSTLEGKFHTDRMKDNFPHLAAAIEDVCGVTLVMVAGAPRADGSLPTSPARPAARPSGDDLFSNFMSRFGGVEVDPRQAREPR